MINAENVLANALAQIYAPDTPMQSLISIDLDPTLFETIDAPQFIIWIDSQLAGGIEIRKKKRCSLDSDEKIKPQDQSAQQHLYSRVAPPGTISISSSAVGPMSRASLQALVIVGRAENIPNAPFTAPIARKYCNREHRFRVGAGSKDITPVRIRCLTEITYVDEWMVLFCDPIDCTNRAASELVAEAIARDPEVIAFAKSADDVGSRGPYLIRVGMTRQ